MKPVVHDQVLLSGGVAELAEQVRHLAPMVGAMVGEMQEDLPDGALMGVARNVAIGDDLIPVGGLGPFDVAVEEGEPFLLPGGAVGGGLVVAETAGGTLLEAVPPDLVGHVDVRQGPAQGTVGPADCAIELFRGEGADGLYGEGGGPAVEAEVVER